MKNKAIENTIEDIFRERAAVLSRTGEKLALCIEKLENIAAEIDKEKEIISNIETDKNDHEILRLIDKINSQISIYNEAHKRTLLQYYYLIVTREAMGLRCDRWVEDAYKIPPRKKSIAYVEI